MVIDVNDVVEVGLVGLPSVESSELFVGACGAFSEIGLLMHQA